MDKIYKADSYGYRSELIGFLERSPIGNTDEIYNAARYGKADLIAYLVEGTEYFQIYHADNYGAKGILRALINFNGEAFFPNRLGYPDLYLGHITKATNGIGEIVSQDNRLLGFYEGDFKTGCAAVAFFLI